MRRIGVLTLLALALCAANARKPVTTAEPAATAVVRAVCCQPTLLLHLLQGRAADLLPHRVRHGVRTAAVHGATAIEYETVLDHHQETCYRTVMHDARTAISNTRSASRSARRAAGRKSVHRACSRSPRPRIRECHYTVQKPVWTTEERECRRLVYRPVVETVQQQYCNARVMDRVRRDGQHRALLHGDASRDDLQHRSA